MQLKTGLGGYQNKIDVSPGSLSGRESGILKGEIWQIEKNLQTKNC